MQTPIRIHTQSPHDFSLPRRHRQIISVARWLLADAIRDERLGPKSITRRGHAASRAQSHAFAFSLRQLQIL
jgi:hypothetical protein